MLTEQRMERLTDDILGAMDHMLQAMAKMQAMVQAMLEVRAAALAAKVETAAPKGALEL